MNKGMSAAFAGRWLHRLIIRARCRFAIADPPRPEANLNNRAMSSSFWAVASAFDLRKLAYSALLYLIGPILLLIFPTLPFANDGNCDPWYVYGLYFNLPEYLKWDPNGRQTGRLTETLPGYFLTHILPGIASDYALFLLFFTSAVFFLYKAAALLLTRERAALVAIFFALSPVVIGNYAVTFSGPGVTYEILALYCAVHALRSAGVRQLSGWMFLSGIAWGAGLHAHLAVLAFSGFIYLLFALSILFEFDRSIRHRIGMIALGAAATLSGVFALTAALSTFATLAWGAKHWVILNQVYRIPRTLENNATYYWQSDWYRDGPQIGMYLFGLAAAAIGIVAHRRILVAERNTIGFQRFELAIAISFAVTLIVLIADELLHGIFLEYTYYYVFLWPFLALAIFAFDIDINSRMKYFFVFFFATACFLCVATKQYRLPDWVTDRQTGELIVIAIVAIVLLRTLQRTHRAVLFGVYLLVLALSMLIARPNEMEDFYGKRRTARSNGTLTNG